jgi:pyruvate dehydrogenase E1 component beta subunit
MAELVRQAALQLAFEAEVFVELVVPTQLAPFDLAPLFDSLRGTQRLLVVEEGTLSLGWGAEVLARCFETLGPAVMAARRLAAQEIPIPVAKSLEAEALPGVLAIIEAARLMV